MDEPTLVRGLKEKRGDAVQVYLERYRPLFFHCIGHFEGDSSLHDDLFQELSWHAIDRLCKGRFDPTRGSFGTWLYRVAWCRCVDLKRRQNARRQVHLTLLADDLPDHAAESPGPDETAGDEEVGGLVRAAIGTLEQQDRRLLELRFVNGQTLVQISEELQITTEQAKYRLKRASAAMRKALLSRVSEPEAIEC